MELSVPLQFTSSIQIFPVPVKRGAHSFLAVIREAERRRKGNMPVNDMTMAGPAGGFSNLVEAIFPLLYLECIYDLWLSFL